MLGISDPLALVAQNLYILLVANMILKRSWRLLSGVAVALLEQSVISKSISRSTLSVNIELDYRSLGFGFVGDVPDFLRRRVADMVKW